ncbi:heme peroxidase [Obba rivulosa]|uniref:Heme peroxidase n=1 Tax=Obba rivulosa TaxID=1052685 RepID=A0A8E2AXL1_9APHY|nr:heme peroxidase [Obba rivulosa]
MYRLIRGVRFMLTYYLLGACLLWSFIYQLVTQLKEAIQHGLAFIFQDLPAVIDAIKNVDGVGIDDRKLLLEKGLTFLSSLPEDNFFAQRLHAYTIGLLYKDLPHPPSGYLALPSPVLSPTGNASKNVHYAFRSADGRDYNPFMPTFGMAGSPYARSVPSANPMPQAHLPDPGLIFDTLLKRNEFIPHPGGISNLFFAFADLVVHSCFNTNRTDWAINNTSSYLDLSPLYGNNDKQVNSVRVKDGYGKMFEDTFADSRILMMPPSVCSLLILFCRNHNFVAQKIYEINENGTYKDPATLDDSEKPVQDDEIFHRARLVNSSYFVQVILGDYVGAILGLDRDGSAWRLKPLEPVREPHHEFLPLGHGNAVSIEFNLLYRWHATTSLQDEQWTQQAFKKLFGDKDPANVTVDDFKKAVSDFRPTTAPKTWEFAEAKRSANGRFSDAVLAEYLLNATEAPARAFGARGTPAVLRVIEMMGIEQSRNWGTCSLNKFRKFMRLKPYSTFKEWNPDKEIYTAAEALYHDIDNLELHVGLQAEETKKPMPGAGFCPGYTISRAILADAVALTRGDRFLTVEFTPFNLTSWGYQDCQLVKKDGSKGGFLPKLLFRHLPEYYPVGSAYAHFPFIVPSTMKGYIAKWPGSPVEQYTWARPVPKKLAAIATRPEIHQGLHEKAHFQPAIKARILELTKGERPARDVVTRVLLEEKRLKKWADVFQATAQELIKQKSLSQVKSRTRYIDIVKDVINLVPVQWIADQIVGISLRMPTNPCGDFASHELYRSFATVAKFVFEENQIPEKVFAMRQNAQKTAGFVSDTVQEQISSAVSANSASSIAQRFAISDDNSHDFLGALASAGKGSSRKALAAGVFAEVVATAALYSRVVTYIVDYCMDGSRRDQLTKLVKENSPRADAEILHLIRQVISSRPSVAKVQRVPKSVPKHPDLHGLSVGDEGVAKSASKLRSDFQGLSAGNGVGKPVPKLHPDFKD